MGVWVKTGKFDVVDLDALNQQEERNRIKEALDRQEDAATPVDGQIPMADAARRMGRMIQVNQFINIIRRLNPALIVELSKADPSKFGIYVRPHSDSGHPTELQFITGMESGTNFGGGIGTGFMPEFSIVLNTPIVVMDETNTVRESKQFVREIRGWRTVLATLYLDGWLTEPDIERTFQISRGEGSERWHDKVHHTITI